MVPDTTLPVKSVPSTRTTYESAPQVRNLIKEATARFVPSAVKRKIDATKGKGGKLLEEEEVQRLESEGYGGAATTSRDGMVVDAAPEVGVERGVTDMDGGESERRRLEEEEEKFRREMEMEIGEDEDEERIVGPEGVEMEEVSDEDM